MRQQLLFHAPHFYYYKDLPGGKGLPRGDWGIRGNYGITLIFNFSSFTTKRLWTMCQMRLNLMIYVNDLTYSV